MVKIIAIGPPAVEVISPLAIESSWRLETRVAAELVCFIHMLGVRLYMSLYSITTTAVRCLREGRQLCTKKACTYLPLAYLIISLPIIDWSELGKKKVGQIADIYIFFKKLPYSSAQG
jgi:hypothetical protein